MLDVPERYQVRASNCTARCCSGGYICAENDCAVAQKHVPNKIEAPCFKLIEVECRACMPCVTLNKDDQLLKDSIGSPPDPPTAVNAPLTLVKTSF